MESQEKIAVITGAGSGVGRAVAIALSKDGWDLRLIGRRREPLVETLGFCGNKGMVIPSDVADSADVEKAKWQILNAGAPQALVNCAGTNVARRRLEEVSVEDYRAIVDVNLNGTYYCVQAFLPEMRRRGCGTIVNVISDAGLLANGVAGAAYIAAKFGVTGLTATINAEERKNGIRACAILPGEIDTPLLLKRANYPTEEQRKRMLQPEDVAACVMLAIRLPDRAVVEQLLVRPR
ncbi:MAG TPA: SDR family oxidoreductase [Tepidisphaeraceae bacterium]|jgi:NAD(P)-dependent dehydrogenase (short-subunit alcohol dehydrogenase family)|nr:SDR family oxidoreductase [Tepidisphaeraceae bacterium]